MQMPDTPLFVKTHDFVLWLLFFATDEHGFSRMKRMGL
jgi:hypothetical protein